MITLQNISKKYGSVSAVEDVSLRVKRGELFGLIGPDGAGKTSLFRILTTLIKPDGGKATVAGLDCVADYRTIRCRIGYMPEHFSLYQDLTIEENIRFFAAIFEVDYRDGLQRISAIYRQIEPFKKRRAGKLSGGMKQKLALCCALIHRPEVLFLDEPTTGVDAVSRREFWGVLSELKREGMTILVSTPYMDEADRCDRIALINEGQLLGIETPEGFRTKYEMTNIEDVFIHLTGGSAFPIKAARTETDREEYAIRVNRLTKRFGDFTAVNQISFDVKKGEIFGFLGANGAGKTTAIRMLCGLSRPTSGGGTVAGMDIVNEPEAIKRHIGYMSQKFSLYDDLTVRENIDFFGGIYGLPDELLRERGNALLHHLDFEDLADKLVSSLPPGKKQKLAFSIAMIHRPEIVFLDEPTGGVDPNVRREFWSLIYEAARTGTTIFVTTHYMDEAEYCHRVSITVDGTIQALDTPDGLKRRFGADSLDSVFRLLARDATRSE